MTILIVEDNPKTLQFLTAALGKQGYTMLAADNAKTALAMMADTKVDLILADVMMPEMDGIEFCQIVRQQQKEDEYIPIIFLTAKSSVDDVATGMIAGADDYLIKPIHLNELLKKIKEYAM
jgi:two-component system, cell cycle response regulator